MYACNSCHHHTNFQKISGECTANLQLTFHLGCKLHSPFQTKCVKVVTPDMEHLIIFLKSHDYEISDNYFEKVKCLVKTPIANLFVSILLFVMLHV